MAVLLSSGCYDLASLRAPLDGASPDSAIDLAGADFTGIDLAGFDVATPIDLAGDFAGTVPACPSFAFFCDGFESGDLSKWQGKQQGNANVSVGVDVNNVRTGTYSLDVVALSHGDGGESNDGYAIYSIASPSVGTTLAMRIHAFMPATPSTAYIFNIRNRTDNLGVSAGIEGGSWNVQDTTFMNHVGTGIFQGGRWVCIELRLDVDIGSSGYMQLLVDDQTVVAAAGPTLPAGGLSEIDIGLIYSPGDITQNLFVDDVAFAHQPIGCDPP
jgi:hypothetical protein